MATSEGTEASTGKSVLGNKMSRIESRALSDNLVGAVALATAPDRVTGPPVRGALSARAANTLSKDDWNSESLN